MPSEEEQHSRHFKGAGQLQDASTTTAAILLLEVSRAHSPSAPAPASFKKPTAAPTFPFSAFAESVPWQSRIKEPEIPQEPQSTSTEAAREAQVSASNLQMQPGSRPSSNLSTTIHWEPTVAASQALLQTTLPAPEPLLTATPVANETSSPSPAISSPPNAAQPCMPAPLHVSTADLLAFQPQISWGIPSFAQMVQASQHVQKMLGQQATAMLPFAHGCSTDAEARRFVPPSTGPLLQRPYSSMGFDGPCRWEGEPALGLPLRVYGDDLGPAGPPSLSGRTHDQELDRALCMLQQAQEMTALAKRRIWAISEASHSRHPGNKSPKRKLSHKHGFSTKRANSHKTSDDRNKPGNVLEAQICSDCGTRSTPAWRRSGALLMCNACGLRRRRSVQLPRPHHLPAAAKAL